MMCPTPPHTPPLYTAAWGYFQVQPVSALHAGLVGQAYWTSDTGGYFGGNVSDPSFQELVVRWSQFSAFSPLMRYHGGRAGPGDPDDPVCGKYGT